MAKVLTGQVVSTKMKDTAVVEITRRVAHPLYKKLMKRSSKFKVAINGTEVKVGDTVQIVETKKMAKDKYFKVEKILATGAQAPVVKQVEQSKPTRSTKKKKGASAK